MKDLGSAIALLLAQTEGPRTFNAAGGASVRLLDLLAAANEAFGRPVDVEQGPPRPGDIYISRPRVERLRSVGFEPRISLVEGLREIWQATGADEGAAS